MPHDSTLPNGRYGAYRTRLTDAYLATALRTFAQIGSLRSPKFRLRWDFVCPQNIIRNAVPKKDKNDGRENLKTEKVFNMTMEKVVANNHSKKRDVQKGETLTTLDSIMLFI